MIIDVGYSIHVSEISYTFFCRIAIFLFSIQVSNPCFVMMVQY